MARSRPSFGKFKEVILQYMYLGNLKIQVIFGMKWGWMGDYGLILNQEGDLSLRKVFKYHPGPNNLI